MSGSLGRLASTSSCKTSKQSLIISSSAYSTFAAGGGGRGRGGGRGSGSGSSGAPDLSPAQTPGKPDTDAEADDAFFPSGFGHGRGKPIPSTPILPSFSSWISAASPPAGRGIVRTTQPQPNPRPSESEGFQPKKPIFFSRQDTQKPQSSDSVLKLDEDILPSSLLPGLPGAGRGKPPKPSPSPNESTGTEENRHLQSRRGGAVSMQDKTSPSQPRLSREDAVKKAVGILSRGRGDGMEDGGRGRGLRGRSGRGRAGRGVQGWRGRGGRSAGRFRDADEDYATGLYLGDNADGERLAKRLGPENMDKLAELFEHMSYDVLPSPVDDAYLDAVHTNNMIEFEPEYLMGEFDANPDIDEKPPIPLRDALEKMKPFLMAYEGIQSQEEWEEIMKETMEKVPYMKELIDIYSGPDRVTAKQQQEELERVAKTLPDNVPSTVKRFTDRAVLSLQSNPGWGFDKKCQFMDKLVWEVSQQYK
ncbi:COPII coat assembly protein sec16-like [Telopea speciosissima]|uniref:COPII coat assembly protein sec16-like n=1 Tax=Telopea speciosissima TaxID=54955 RepID=UPI001CC5EBF4|nr:COPII coat assembly protein sec16-like [Telopea speciosissima]XP_043723921.1 COPII coat assembly protein sec16-like [Telopea speciosissima]XP_043723922.1 COPII coat assembly protein sec16-like [Telopea speciosissima]XP_043723923.1 COPII coat assembly protein sec16-like [Telopea speciosissima]XP_043723924.1 COPII coat assembly protein sec16-like [Telopea speciosissima]